MEMKLFPDYGYVIVSDISVVRMLGANYVCTSEDKHKHEEYVIYQDDKGNHYAVKQ